MTQELQSSIIRGIVDNSTFKPNVIFCGGSQYSIQDTDQLTLPDAL